MTDAIHVLRGAMLVYFGELKVALAKPHDDIEAMLVAWDRPVFAMHNLINQTVDTIDGIAASRSETRDTDSKL